MCSPTNDPTDGVSVYPTLCKGNIVRQKIDKKKDPKLKNSPEEYKYVCVPLCKYGLKVIDAWPAGTNSVKYDKTKATTELTSAKETNWFKNVFKDRCGITKCEIRNAGCKSAYTGGKVEVKNTTVKGSTDVKITFSTVSNIPDGYSETVCVACSNPSANGGGAIVYKDGWVVEQN